MAVLRSLVTTLGLNSAQYRADLKRAQKTTADFANKLKSIGTQSASALKSITGAAFNLKTALVAVGSGAALYGVKQAYENADAIRRQGELIGVSADAWSRYQYAAGVAGVDTEQLADTFKDLGVKITDAAKTGSGPMVDFFTQINQDAADWAALSPDEQFQRFTDELNQMSDSDARFYLDEINDSAFSLFTTLRNGELARLTGEAEQLGIALSSAQFAAIAETRQELSALAQTGVGVWQQVIAAAAPAVTSVSAGIRQWITDQANAAGGFRQLGIVIAETVLQTVADTVQMLENMMNVTYRGAEKLANLMGETLNPQTAQLQQQLRSLQGEYRYLDNLINTVQTEDAFIGVASPEQLERFAALRGEIKTVKTQLATLNSSFDFADSFQQQVDSIVLKMQTLSLPSPATGISPGGTFGTVTFGGEDPQAKMEAELELLRQKYASEQELLLEKTLMEQEILVAAEQAKLISEQESQALRKQSWDEYYDSVSREAENAANQQAQAQANANATIQQMQVQVMQQAVGLIKATAEEGSGLWMAALITEKGIAVAQALIHAEVAAMSALASVPYPGNMAAYSKMKMLGYASAALIAATGVAEIAGARATGGPVTGGKTYWVGEQGPELFTAGTSGTVTSNRNLSQAMKPNWVINVIDAPPETTVNVDQQAQTVNIAVARAKSEINADIERGGNETANNLETVYGLNRAWGI